MNIIERIKCGLLAVILPSVLFLASCEKTDYMTFDSAYTGIYFTKDTLNYSFGVTPIEIRTHTYNIPVKIMGPLSSEKRPIAYNVRADLTTAEEGVHYSIGEAVVLPDSINGYIPVVINRDNLEGTHLSGYTRYKLCLELVDNENFTPTLDSLHRVRVFSFDNAVEQPEWLDVDGEKVWPEKYLGVWHPYKFIKMVEYFHALNDVLPETYKKMVQLYGENLENIPYGDTYVYRTVFVKYVFSPMYEFFANPDNKDMILSEYPDFPFDFPDPYTVK